MGDWIASIVARWRGKVDLYDYGEAVDWCAKYPPALEDLHAMVEDASIKGAGFCSMAVTWALGIGFMAGLAVAAMMG